MKFSIRDLFLVTVIVALVLGWWVHARSLNLSLSRSEDRLATLKNLIEQHGYTVEDTGRDIWLKGWPR